jgi:hypothetical protein
MIRVGSIKYKNGKKIYPKIPEGFIPIEVMTKSTKYGELGPYVLKNEKNQIMECIWQFSKLYKHVPKRKELYSRFQKFPVWDHPSETHIKSDMDVHELRNMDINELLSLLDDSYWVWRNKGFNNKYHVRYPVGFKMRSDCICSLWKENGEFKKYNYIEARKHIYFKVYSDMVVKCKKYEKLKNMLGEGKNLLIMEVDGPTQTSLEYYKEKYGVGDDFIIDDSSEINKKNIKIFLNDGKHPFGHGYCLASCLLGIDVSKL